MFTFLLLEATEYANKPVLDTEPALESQPQRTPSPTRVSLDSHHNPSNIILHSPLPAPQNRQLVLSTSGPQAPGMPIILAPRPLHNQVDSECISERPDSLPLKMTSTDITGIVIDKEQVSKDDSKQGQSNQKPLAEKLPKIMTNTVYDI